MIIGEGIFRCDGHPFPVCGGVSECRGQLCHPKNAGPSPSSALVFPIHRHKHIERNTSQSHIDSFLRRFPSPSYQALRLLCALALHLPCPGRRDVKRLQAIHHVRAVRFTASLGLCCLRNFFFQSRLTSMSSVTGWSNYESQSESACRG